MQHMEPEGWRGENPESNWERASSGERTVLRDFLPKKRVGNLRREPVAEMDAIVEQWNKGLMEVERSAGR